jgi:poly-gamma-glutamate capsule biosynthesis protein CapA/YwtB (metallophosphatase superfamily)
MDAEGVVTLCAVGDIMVNRDDPASIFDLAGPVLRDADATFGNCESTYSERGSRNPATRGEVRAHPRNLDAFTAAGFDVVSFANNHHLDAGYDAFFDTLDALRERGIATCGAGRDLAEARQPAILERNGTRVAFLGYSAILFPGYEAADNRPGCAPLRVHTHYEQVEIEQPGSAPDVITFTREEDLEALREDVRVARERADVVVVTPHWGIHFEPATIAQYETEVGRAAIDAGADVVLGHHQHILKPVQVYKGKVIVHGMGNFAMDADIKKHGTSPAVKEMQARYPGYCFAYQEETPTYPFPAEARMTVIVRCEITGGAFTEVALIPCYINAGGQPEPLRSDDPRFAQVADYLRTISESQGLDTTLKAVDDRLVVEV